MIKAAGTTATGRPLLIVGLSAENCRRLLAGQAIRFNTAYLGLPETEVLIVAGETEQVIAAELRDAYLTDERTEFKGTVR